MWRHRLTRRQFISKTVGLDSLPTDTKASITAAQRADPIPTVDVRAAVNSSPEPRLGRVIHLVNGHDDHSLSGWVGPWRARSLQAGMPLRVACLARPRLVPLLAALQRVAWLASCLKVARAVIVTTLDVVGLSCMTDATRSVDPALVAVPLKNEGRQLRPIRRQTNSPR